MYFLLLCSIVALDISSFLIFYFRVTGSVTLAIERAIAIAVKTSAPANKLDKKFSNEGVIMNELS